MAASSLSDFSRPSPRCSKFSVSQHLTGFNVYINFTSLTFDLSTDAFSHFRPWYSRKMDALMQKTSITANAYV